MEEFVKGSRIKNGINIGVYFGGIFLFPSVIIILMMLYFSMAYSGLSQSDIQEKVFDNILYIMGFTSLLTFIIILAINFKDLKRQFVMNLKNKYTYIYPLILFVVYFVVVAILSAVIGQLSPDLAEPDNNQALIDMFNDGNKIVFFINVIVLAPVVEELVFRYSLVNLFHVEKKGLRWVPYFVSAFVFAAIHEVAFITDFTLDNVLQYLSYLVPGLVLAFGYMFTKRNIVSMIILHMAINVLASVAIAFM